MNDPLKIQLAIQGGGAKISALLAVMETVQSLQEEDKIEITRIAGTSAGAIAGSLLAANISIKNFKTHIESGAGKEIIKSFPTPSKLKMIRHFFSGVPLYSTKVLEATLSKFFKEADVFRIEDIKKKTGIETLIIAADVSNSQKVIQTKESEIVNAIMNSCGLPYFFRTWSAGGNPVYVDGGICENLPIDELKKHEKNDGPILAISFRRDRKENPRNFQKFTLALLDTAINNSMNRAKSELPENQIFYISTKIGTFDFKKALTEGLGPEYELIKEKSKNFFIDFANQQLYRQYLRETDPWSERNPTATTIMKKLGEVYVLHHEKDKFEYLKCSLTVQANCLLAEHEIGFGEPDWIIYSVEFKPSENPIYCISVALNKEESYKYLNVTSWEVLDTSQGKLVRTIDIPVYNPKFPNDRTLNLFFDPALEPNTGPYKLTFRDRAGDLMMPLKEKGKDELAYIAPRALGKIGCIDLVLHVPERLQKVRMEEKQGIQEGREMTEAELAVYRAQLPLTKFRSLGWTAKQIDASNSIYGVDVYL